MNGDISNRMYSYGPIAGSNYLLNESYLGTVGVMRTERDVSSTENSTVALMLDSKVDRSDRRIEAVIEAMEKRRLIKEENLSGIEQDICTCRNLIFEMGYKVYRRDRDWIALETRQIDLERDRRMELAAYFRDILLLGKELRDTVEYRRSIEDKTKLLGGIS